MGAETMREAVIRLRRDWPLGVSCPDRCGCEDEPIMAHYHADAGFHLAVADWLIQVATARESIDAVSKHKGDPLGQGSDMFLAQERHALAVARAYLGDAPDS